VVLAEVVVAIGFVLAVLGIREVGGLFNLGVGFLLVFVGSIPIIVDLRRESAFDEELWHFLERNG
jgi:hypothetical protein